MIQRNPPSSLPPLSPSQTAPDPEKSEKLGKAERYVSRKKKTPKPSEKLGKAEKYVNRAVSKKTTET